MRTPPVGLDHDQVAAAVDAAHDLDVGPGRTGRDELAGTRARIDRA